MVMGLLGSIITKGVATAAKNSTIRAVGAATATVIETAAKNHVPKEVVVIKNGMAHIKPTRSSDDYCGKNALDIAHELLGAGFERISLKSVHRLGAHSKKRYGEVVSISINGKKDFLGIKKVPASSHIVIEYLDFKSNVSKEIYESVRRITSNTVCRGAETRGERQAAEHVNKFCPCCGEHVEKENAKFCSNCGEKL